MRDMFDDIDRLIILSYLIDTIISIEDVHRTFISLFSINTARHYLWVFNHYVKRHTFMLDQSWVWKWLQYPWSLCEWGHWPPTTGAHLMLGRGRDGGRLAQAYTGSCLGREQVGVKRCHYHNRIHWPSVVPAWQSDFTSCRRELSGTVAVF